MRHGVGKIDKKRLVLFFTNEPNRFVGVPLGQRRHIGLRFDQFFIAIKVNHGIVAGRRAKEIIETLTSRKQIDEEPRLSMFGQIPLAKACRGIAFLFQNLRDSNLFTMQDRVDLLDVSALGNTKRITAGHDRGARRATDRLRIKAGELHPRFGHRIQTWRPNIRRPKTADILITLIIGKNDHEVRRLFSGSGLESETQNPRGK